MNLPVPHPRTVLAARLALSLGCAVRRFRELATKANLQLD
jgi:hypothetical protein